MNPQHKLLPLLDKVRSTGADKWLACCPAHSDKSPSLSIRQLDDGRMILHCFAGCPNESVISALGLTFADLYPEDINRNYQPIPKGQRWIPRDALTALSGEIWVVRVAAAMAQAGRPLNEENSARLSKAAHRLEAGFREVMG